MGHVDTALRRYKSEKGALARPQTRETKAEVAVRPPESTPDQQSVELGRLMAVLLRRKYQILLILIIVVTPVAVWTVRAERLYRSAALIQVDPEPVQVLPYRELDRPAMDYELYMKSQEQLLRGSALRSRVANRLEELTKVTGAANEIPRLAGAFGIQRIENTQMFRLNYVSPSPELAAETANLFAEEYIKLHLENRQQTRSDAQAILKRELENIERRVQQNESELISYAQANGLREESAQTPSQRRLSQLHEQLTNAEAAVFAAQARLDSLQGASLADFPEGIQTPVISGLVNTLLTLQHELTALRARFGENWPDVVQKRGEIALVREQIDDEKESALAQSLEQASIELGIAESQRNSIKSSLAEQEEVVKRQEDATVEYNILRREVETDQQMYEGLLERLQQTSITTGMAFPGLHIVEPAIPAGAPYSPRPVWNLSLASLFGLALGVCFAFMRDFWDHSISTVEEVESLTGLSVLGAIPKVHSDSSYFAFRGNRKLTKNGSSQGGLIQLLPKAGSGPASTIGDNVSVTESIRNICASLLLSRAGRPPQVVMVTSTVQGEGKTTLACELASALAQSNAKTLLVECDLRRSTLGAKFELSDEGGLSIFLSGNSGPSPTIHETHQSHLCVVVAGPAAPNPPALLSSEKMEAFLEATRSGYHFIILDAPPLLPIADARVLASMADGVVVVVRARSVTRPAVQRARAILERAGANVLGVVLNAEERSFHNQSRYEQYYSYYSP